MRRRERRAARMARAAERSGRTYLDIHVGRDKRLAGLTGYGAVFGILGLIVAKAFTALGISFGFALVLVSFMVGFMLVMGWLVGRGMLEHG